MRESFERLLVGRVLGERYAVEDKIGAGGMSVVYRGRDLRLGRPVAVKVVSLAADSPTERTGLRNRFRREAASAASIPHHPNVVQVFDYGTDPELDLDFLVMELILGRDLKEALLVAPPSQGTALRVLREAARGLAAGHRAGIVHRDVKPANIFLVGDEELEGVRILDFGIAKPLEPSPAQDLTRTGQLPHSPAYASPEQLDPRQHVTFASDVYQLGLIGYEMLSGERAFTPDERMRLASGEELPLPIKGRWLELPSPVRAVIERALRPRPADRYPDAAAFAEALSQAMKAPPRPVPVAAPVEPAHDATLAAPVRVVQVPPAEPPPAAGPVGVPVGVPAGPPPTASPRGGLLADRRVLVLAPLLLVLLFLGVRAMSGGGGDAPAAGETADAATVAARDERFLRLQGQVAEAAGESGGEPDAPGASPPAPAPPPGPAGAVGVMAAAEQEIRAAVDDLNRAWVEGEISRHVAHYASRVDYYNSRRLPRAGVRRDRQRDLRRYEDARQITVHSTRVEFQAPDQARALVDKEWYFAGDGGTRRGRGMQEYVFKRDEDDGKWYVVGEQLLSTSEQRSREDGD